MMATIAEVREALASAASMCGVRVAPYESDSITIPCGYVARRGMDPRLVFTGATNVHNFAVVFYVARTLERAGQILVDRLAETAGDMSAKAAIEDESHWPGELIHYAQVVNVGETATYDVGGVSYLGVVLDVEVTF